MLETLVNGLLDFFIAVFIIITSPIQNVINSYFPSLNNFANAFMPVFEMIRTEWIPFLKDIVFIPHWCWSLILAYFVFKLVIIFFGNVLSMVFKWWAALVP